MGKKQIIEKIISGGQTGVDRAALDVALELDIPCGGWCPKGRKAEDGKIPSYYPMTEMPSSLYPPRTEKNIKEADGTLILSFGPVTGGTALTVKLADKHKKPHLVIDLDAAPGVESVLEWVQKNNIRVINVAGPRESKAAGVHDKAVVFLQKIFE